MTKSEKCLVLQTALNYFGFSNQVDVAIEEMAELTQALIHNRRGRQSNIAEEIADVVIMLDQLILHYDLFGEVDEFVDKKIVRLAMKLQNEGALRIEKKEGAL